MKTTIELPDALLHRAKVVAAQRKTTLKQLMIEGLENVTASPPAAPRVTLTPEESEVFEIDAYGVPVLKKRSNGITNEMLNTMREELGI
jgi:hypothetical protein